MGAGLLAVKSGFILFNGIFQFFTINTPERERGSGKIKNGEKNWRPKSGKKEDLKP